MKVTCEPNPFPTPEGFQIVVEGGTPPFEYLPLPSPPNPPGVTVTPDGRVSVPSDTPPMTVIQVQVLDSSEPPQAGTATDSCR